MDKMFINTHSCGKMADILQNWTIGDSIIPLYHYYFSKANNIFYYNYGFICSFLFHCFIVSSLNKSVTIFLD